MNILNISETSKEQYFIPTHSLSESGWEAQASCDESNWLDDNQWCAHVKTIVQITPTLAVVFWNNIDAESQTVFKGQFKL